MLLPASPWVTRFASLVAPGAAVLDLACGGGRHGRVFLRTGHPVTLVDKDTSAVADLPAEVITVDLEDGSPWPLSGRRFGGIVVTNYLYRPRLPALMENLANGGVLIYETFGSGNEAYGRPRNPDHLLKAGELLELARAHDLTVTAYEHGLVQRDSEKRVVQRICAVRQSEPVELCR